MRLPRLPKLQILERLIEAGLLLILPLVYSRCFAEQFTYPKSLLAQILIIIGIVFWALEIARGNPSWPGNFRLGTPLGILALAVLVSTVNSPVPRFSLHESAYFLCGPAWVMLLLSWNKGENALPHLATLAALAGTVVAVIALLQWWGHDPLLFGGYRIDWGTMAARMRIYSTFGNPNFVAGYLIGAIFMALGLGAAASNVRTKILWWTAAAGMLAAIAGAGSRGAWVGLVAGLLVAAFMWTLRRNRVTVPGFQQRQDIHREVKLFSLAAPAMLGLFLMVASSPNQTLLGRIEGRTYLWRVSWPIFVEHPIIGGGWATYQLRYLDLQATFLATHPEWSRYWTNSRLLHNDPMQLMLEMGLLGLAAFGWLLWTYGREVRDALHSADSPSTRLWLGAGAGGLTAMLVDSIFNFQFAIPPTFILTFTLLSFPSLAKDLQNGATSWMQAAVSHLGFKRPTPASLSLSGTDATPAKRYGSFVIRVLGCTAVLVCAAALLITTARHAQGEHDYLSAKTLENRADLTSAEGVYRRGLARNPLHGRLHFGLARVLYQSGRYEEALNETRLAECTYADSHTWVLKGYIQERLGKPQQALANFRHAVALDPTLTIVPVEIEKIEKELAKATINQGEQSAAAAPSGKHTGAMTGHR